MVRFSPSIEQRKQFYNCKANDISMVWCSYNEQTYCFYVLTDACKRLHGKAAELCLANT